MFTESRGELNATEGANYLIFVQNEKISQIGNKISLKQLWLSVWSMVGSDGEEANV